MVKTATAPSFQKTVRAACCVDEVSWGREAMRKLSATEDPCLYSTDGDVIVARRLV